MASLSIFGPAGAGDPAPAAADPIAYTLVPYSEAKTEEVEKDRKAFGERKTEQEVLSSGTHVKLQGSEAVREDAAGEVSDGDSRGVTKRR